MNIITIDIGGTEIKSALYQENGELIANFDNRQTQKSENDNQISEQVLDICRKALAQHHIDGVAIATAGVVNPHAGEVIYAGPTIPNYSHTKLKAYVESAFSLPCSVENDVNAMAMGEAWLGAAKGYQSAFCLTLGTGLGGALLFNGTVWHGETFCAGEIGHLPQANGKRLEQLASTTALLNNYEVLTGEKITGKMLFERLQQGDSNAEQALSKMLNTLAHGLASVVLIAAPEIIVVGGGIAAQRDIIEPRLQSALSAQLPSEHFMPKTIRCATLGNRAGMIGALRGWLNIYIK